MPTENEMAAEYQVSRTVVREAMNALKEKGWVQTFVGKRTFIIDNITRGIDSSINLALRNVSTGGQKTQNNHQLINAALKKLDAAAARKWIYQQILQV